MVVTNVYFIAPGAQAYYQQIRSSFTISYNLNPLQPQQVLRHTSPSFSRSAQKPQDMGTHTLPLQPDLQSLGVKCYCFL